MAPRFNPVQRLLDELYDGLDRRRIDDVLRDAGRELGEIGQDWPGWARSLLDLLEAADGSSQGAGAGVSDPTLGAVVRREHLTRARADVFGYLDDALVALTSARATMGRLVRTAGAAQLQRDLDAGRCTGGMGLPRSEVWGDPTCRALALAARGMCWKHYEAWRQDMREENLRRLERYS